MRKLITLIFLLSSPAIASLAFAADDPDAAFYKKAAEGGLFEVEAGNQAQTKANDQRVKDFASMLVTDHTAANDQLKSLAASKGISLPSSPSAGQMAAKTKLDVLTGDTYDKSFVNGQIKAHERTIALFQKEVASGQDADAKAFASSTLPTLRKHLKQARALAAQGGYGKTAG